MKRLIAFVVCAIIVLVAAAFVHDYAGHYVGKRAGWAMAHLDLYRSDYRIIVLGLPEPWEGESNQVFAEKYRIKRDRIAFCIVSHWDLGYQEGFNSVSLPALEAKYSKRLFADAMRESIERYMQTRRPEGGQKAYSEKMLKFYESQ